MAAPDGIGETLVTEEDLERRIAELGAEISRDYAGRDLLLIGVLKGAVPFLADLMRQLEIDCEVDFMAVSSYGSATDSSGVVRILKDLDASIEGPRRPAGGGHHRLGPDPALPLQEPAGAEPASLEVCALLTKPERRRVDLPIRYVGLRDPEPLRDRLRPRPRAALSQPALRGRSRRLRPGVAETLGPAP